VRRREASVVEEGAAEHAGGLSINFTKIEYKFVPYDDKH
jgi:hypothetical protein